MHMLPELDLVFLREAIIDLQEYILSREMFWSLHTKFHAPDGSHLSQLTLGNLVLSQARLAACQLSDVQEKELKTCNLRIKQLREEWLANWQIKEEREFGVRLNLWQKYLRDLRSDPRQNSTFYSQEVRARVILQLFFSEGLVKNVKPQAEQLQMLDQVLQGLTHPAPFVWEEEIASGFPNEQYWFLFVAVNDR
jgi:hypothetical protein